MLWSQGICTIRYLDTGIIIISNTKTTDAHVNVLFINLKILITQAFKKHLLEHEAWT